SSKPRIFSNVDFPHPDGPMMATNSFSRMWRLTLLRARVSTSSVRKLLHRSVVFIISYGFFVRGFAPFTDIWLHRSFYNFEVFFQYLSLLPTASPQHNLFRIPEIIITRRDHPFPVVQPLQHFVVLGILFADPDISSYRRFAGFLHYINVLSASTLIEPSPG